MKSFKEVLLESKKAKTDIQKEKFDDEKRQLLEKLKNDYLITGKIKDASPSTQKNILKALLEYWSPKNGINKKGIDYINEGKISISKNSTSENIKKFALSEVKNNIKDFTSAFANGQGRNTVIKLQENIEIKTGKRIKFKSLFENVCTLITQKIKNDNI